MANYNISVNRPEKRLDIVCTGIVGGNDVKDFVDSFNKAVSTITPADYILNFDTSNFSVISQDMIPGIQGCFEMYQKLHFKKIRIKLNQSNPILKMQIDRVAKIAGLDNYEFYY